MVRLLTTADIPGAMALCAAAGWNQTVEDWARMLALEPSGCFAIESDGHLVATATLLCYGLDLAWIGMVLTHADYRRRGYARRLMCAAIDEALGRGIRCIKLDATDQGRPLYASLGFVDEQPIERWFHPAPVASGGPVLVSGTLPAALDAEAFGADRRRFLETLGAPWIDSNGYALARPGTRARYIGPCVARTSESARRLFQSAITADPSFWDVLPANQRALALATEFGFTRVRSLVRMRYGQPVTVNDNLVFAIAGFEAG